MQNSENDKESFRQATTQQSEKISGHSKSEGPAPTGRTAFKETIRLFITMLATIFLCEAAIMALLYIQPSKRGWEIIANPLLLTILGAPILYWSLVKPIWLVLEQRNRALEELKNEKNFAEGLIKTTQAIILLLDGKGRIEHFNPYMEQISGYRLEEVKGKDWFTTFLPERDQKRIKELFFEARSGIRTCGNINPIITKDGYEREIEWYDKVLRDDKGSVVGLLATGQDITKRKKAEEKLLDYQAKLKSLASQLSVIEERERRRIATELHDQIGQSLVFSKTKLDSMRTSMSSGELDNSLEEVCDCLGQVIRDTRSLTFDLSYPILYELGFEAAVSEWLNEQIGSNYGIKTEFEDDGQTKPLDDDICALLFRNVRELLINVVKHANAQNVKVSICKVDNQICVIVEDDGVGLKPAEVTSLASGNDGFGIFSIRERLEQLGGHLEIESEKGRGSKITMTAPLKLTKSTSNSKN